MKIKSIALKNFKRFTDLVISDIPDTSKLVLLIGSNGSGKSSVFDAFDWLSKGSHKSRPYQHDGISYYAKNADKEPFVTVELANGQRINKIASAGILEGQDLSQKFFGRSGIRIVPRITNTANPKNISDDSDGPLTYIEHDTRFINDVFSYIQEVNNAVRKPIFSGVQANTLKIFLDFIQPLNDSLLRIFGDDKATTIQIAEFEDATPGSAAKLIFKKGDSKINYDLLSHGEKQVVILLINFIVRGKYYDDAIIFIDEMDGHLNTALQFNLIAEIVAHWIPEDSQLWTASHSLGFIDYAKKSDIASIIDLDLLNFDVKQELRPILKEQLDVYEIAIPKMMAASILKQHYKLVIVENTDAKYFTLALGEEGYLFSPANNNRSVFMTIKADKDSLGLRDRDYLRDDEVLQIQEKLPNLKILSFYTFENYIYHPDNVAELNLDGYDKDEYLTEIVRQKNENVNYIIGEIATSRQHYVELKDCITNDGNIKPIIDSLTSDKFEIFYPHFNMKNHYKKNYLEKFDCAVDKLAQTEWFKNKILEDLKV